MNDIPMIEIEIHEDFLSSKSPEEIKAFILMIMDAKERSEANHVIKKTRESKESNSRDITEGHDGHI